MHSGSLHSAPNEETSKCANLLMRIAAHIPLLPPSEGERVRNLMKQLLHGSLQPHEFCVQFHAVTRSNSGFKLEPLLETGLAGVRELLATKRFRLSNIEFDMAKLRQQRAPPPVRPQLDPSQPGPATVQPRMGLQQSWPRAVQPRQLTGPSQPRTPTVQPRMEQLHLRPPMVLPRPRMGPQQPRPPTMQPRMGQPQPWRGTMQPRTPMGSSMGQPRMGPVHLRTPMRQPRPRTGPSQPGSTIAQPRMGPVHLRPSMVQPQQLTGSSQPRSAMVQPQVGPPQLQSATGCFQQRPLTVPPYPQSTIDTSQPEPPKSPPLQWPNITLAPPQPPTPPTTKSIEVEQVLFTTVYPTDSDIVPGFDLNNETSELTERFYNSSVERSCGDVQLLLESALKRRLLRHMRANGIRECVDTVPALVSHACEWYLKDVLDYLCRSAKNRGVPADSQPTGAEKKRRLTYRITKDDLLWVLEQNRELTNSHFLHKLYL